MNKIEAECVNGSIGNELVYYTVSQKSLVDKSWNINYLNNRHWLSIYNEGFERLESLKRDEDFKNFNFDIVVVFGE